MTRLSALCAAAVGFGLLALSSLAAKAQSDDELYEAGKRESQLTWYSAVVTQEASARLAEAFTRKYPGIKVNSIKSTAQVAFQRLLQEMNAKQIQVDVYTSADTNQFPYLKEKGALVKFRPDNMQYVIQELRQIDPDDFYQGTFLSIIGMAYNSDKIKPEDAPKNWTDLLNPKWKNQIAVGSPNFSGQMGIWVVAMNEMYGWDFFEKLSKLEPLIGRSISDPLTSLNSGERVIAASAVPDVVELQAQKGNPLKILYPSDGSIVSIGPTALIKGSKSPNAAKLFMNYMLSKEAMEVGFNDLQTSVRVDVDSPTNVPSIKGVKLYTLSNKVLEEKLTALRGRWKTTFGGM